MALVSAPGHQSRLRTVPSQVGFSGKSRFQGRSHRWAVVRLGDRRRKSPMLPVAQTVWETVYRGRGRVLPGNVLCAQNTADEGRGRRRGEAQIYIIHLENKLADGTHARPEPSLTARFVKRYVREARARERAAMIEYGSSSGPLSPV